MALDKIEDIIEDIRLGKPVILMDDEDRENEGDLIIACRIGNPGIDHFLCPRGLRINMLAAHRGTGNTTRSAADGGRQSLNSRN